MDIRKMEVRVSVVNEMRKLRKSTYSDRLTWVDELVQNCQRSGASHIKVIVERDRVVVADNGVGCDNPEFLFDKSRSGWGEEVDKAENPFGEGFFSTLMISDRIKISSVGFNAEFNAREMFESESVDCIRVTGSTRKKGFVVVLTDLLPEYDAGEVAERFREVGKYIQSPTMSVNGSRVKFVGLNSNSDNPFVRKLSTPYFKGWIQPFKWGKDGYESELKAFAFSRFVNDLVMWGVKGILSMTDGAVALRSPDRRAFVQDADYYKMKDTLLKEVRKMFIDVIRRGEDSDIDAYAEEASRYLKVEDYGHLIRLKLLAEDTQKESDEFVREYDTSYTELSSTSVIKPKEGAMESPIYTETDQVGLTIPNEGILVKDFKYAFYVESVNKAQYVDQIQLCKLYSIPVVEIRNCLEEKVVSSYEQFKHISNLNSMVKLRARYQSVEPQNEAEKRAQYVLDTIGRAIAGRDMFWIADLNCERVIQIGNAEKEIEKVEAFALAYGSDIYINRKYMNKYKGLKDSGENLNENDREFVLSNLNTIAHEMSHSIYGTVDNTKEHFEMIGTLMQKIIDMMYGK